FSTAFSSTGQIRGRMGRTLRGLVILLLLTSVVLTGARRAGGWWRTWKGTRPNMHDLYRYGQLDASILMNSLSHAGRSAETLIYVDDSDARIYLAVMAGACIYDTRMLREPAYRTTSPVRVVMVSPRNGDRNRIRALAGAAAPNRVTKVADLTEVELYEA